MDLGLVGKRALITGSNSGIGAAIAREFVAEGAAVVVHGRDSAKTEAMARALTASGALVATATGDVTDDADAGRLATAALSAFGGIDILVNSAGGVVHSDNPEWDEIEPSRYLDAYNLNVASVVRLVRLLTPGMIAGGWGRIINISSIGGSSYSGRLHDYGAAKAALDHLSGNLSRVLAPKGVTVNAVVPGTILTPQSERWIATLRQEKGWPDDLPQNERTYTSEFAPQSVPRLGRPEEIAAAVAFLASPRAGYITGTTLRIDGGATKGR